MILSSICLLDTSITSKNMGDHIIVDSIRRILEDNFPETIFINIATHDYLSPEAYKIIASCDISIVCGTNLLCGNLETYKQWKIQSKDFLMLRNVVLMGVGWWQYQETISQYSSTFYNLCLSNSTIHSVRDQYTLEMLKKACPNKLVVNTACPTMWTLSKKHTEQINNAAKINASCCVTTITDYKADPERDVEMINHLFKCYDNVFVWIQGSGDLDYLKKLEPRFEKNLQYISPTLSAYDYFLRDQKRVDFIGTRLHAGIRALQWGHPATIVEVDNRAQEISKDTGLPTWPRKDDFAQLITKHRSNYYIKLRLPVNNMTTWLESVKETIVKS